MMGAKRILLVAAAVALGGVARAEDTASEVGPGPMGGLPTVYGRPTPVPGMNGGKGGNAAIQYNFNLGGPPGGQAVNGPAPMLPTTASPLTLSRCTLVIAGKPEIDARGCLYTKAGGEFTVTAPSGNGRHVHTVRVAVNVDGTGTGTAYVGGGRTPQERKLGILVRKGACWVAEGGAAELCAWR